MPIVNIYIQELNESTKKIVNNLRLQRNQNIKIWLYRNEAATTNVELLVKNWRDVKFIEYNHQIDDSITYFVWDINQCQANILSCGLKWVISRNDQTLFCVLSQIPHRHNTIIMFKDAVHMEHLPERFIKAPCFNNLSDIIEYCKEEGVFDFSLEDVTKFSIANGISPVQGARVYEEISSKRFWYLDMLHKNHYEVFDAIRKHLGEANLNGILDISKKDKTKRL